MDGIYYSYRIGNIDSCIYFNSFCGNNNELNSYYKQNIIKKLLDPFEIFMKNNAMNRHGYCVKKKPHWIDNNSDGNMATNVNVKQLQNPIDTNTCISNNMSIYNEK